MDLPLPGVEVVGIASGDHVQSGLVGEHHQVGQQPVIALAAVTLQLDKEMIGAMRKGDRVITSGGLHGTVTGMTETVVTMEIAPKVRVKVSRGSIAGVSKGNES